MRHSNGMVRRSPLLTVVLALLLVMQWGGAFAHCIEALAGTQSVEICTTDGIRTLHLDAEGQPAAPDAAAHDSCPLCPGATAALPEGPLLPAARFAYVVAIPRLVAGMPMAPARAPPQQPRAPPIA
jgi:hypothetical protein